MAGLVEGALNPERLDLEWCSGDMLECDAKLSQDPEGDYVRWSDFAALRALALMWREQRDGYRSQVMATEGRP